MYIIVCMGFVFSAMLELAIVLVLKQKQGWVNAMENVIEYDAHLEETIFKTRVEVANDVSNREMAREVGSNVEETKDNEIGNASRWSRIVGIFHSLPFTTRIDLSAILLFYLFFFVMNCIYWTTVLN